MIEKEYGKTTDYVLYEMSYANLIMYGAVIPSYDDDEDKGGVKTNEKSIKADDPKNRDLVKKILFE